MKRIIIILTLILALILSFSVCYAAEINFTDVKDTDWYYKNLQELIEKDVVGGYPDGTFKPNNNLKFEEFIKMLVIAVEDENLIQEEGQEWYEVYINSALDNGYISNKQLSLIGTDIDRGTMSLIMYNVIIRSEGVEGYSEEELNYLCSQLSDLSISDKETLTIAGMGIICGYPDETFKPAGNLTRGETVAVISRLIDKEQRLPVDFPEIDTRTLDELAPVDLSHLYEIPTLLGKTVEEENKDILYPTEISFALGEPNVEIKELFKLLHNRDYRIIENNKEQYIKDVNYYLGGVKEYKGKQYDRLKEYSLKSFEGDQEGINYVLSKGTYIEDFFDEWIKDTVENKVKVQADFYTDENLIIYVNGWRAVRGTLRIKYDSHLKPENIKYELDFIETELIKKNEESHISNETGVNRNSYNIYKDFNELPQLEVGKWYEIDLDVALSGRLVNPKLYVENGEKVIDSYEYVYVLDIRELEN